MKKLLLFIVPILFTACIQPTDIGRFLSSPEVQDVIDRNQNQQSCQCNEYSNGCCQEDGQPPRDSAT